MAKLKKIITTICLAVVLLASSLLLFACNSKVSATDSYNLLNSLITIYKTESEMFGQGLVKGVDTEFYLQSFKAKDSGGNLIVDSENHLAFVAIGMNYLDENVAILNGLDVKYDYKNFNKQILEMNDAYNNLFKEFANLKTLDSAADYNIYNGYYARYREYATYFIDEIFDVAKELGVFIVQQFGDGIGQADLTGDDFNRYVAYNKLLISNDYKNLLIDNLQGKDFDEDLAEDAQQNFDNYCLLVVGETDLAPSNEKATEVKNLFESVNVDRKNVEKSLKNFSLNDLYTIYDVNLSAYEKVDFEAPIYYNNIQSYFGDEGILSQLLVYMIQL